MRVLLGSTQKMGTGTNVQKRLIALHHLDAPWKPAEVEQRDGRILRQGNENKEVAIYRYVTEGSFDAYMWQALETKARFIGQVMTGDNTARRAEDIGGQELSYAEVKAIASGNPAVLTLAEADAELQRLSLLKKNHLDEQYVARRSVRDLPKSIHELAERIAKLTKDEAILKNHAADPVTIGNTHRGSEELVEALAGKLAQVPWNVREQTRVPLGSYKGLKFGLIVHPQFPPDVYLEGEITRTQGLSREHQGPRAILNAIDRIAGNYRLEIERYGQEKSIAESQLRDYQARLGKEFLHEKTLNELTGLRHQLKECLSAKPDDENCEGPSAEKIAERIKALKADQVSHEVAVSGARKESVGEEPVTKRVMRRMEDRGNLRIENEVLPLPESNQTETNERNSVSSFADRVLQQSTASNHGRSQNI